MLDRKKWLQKMIQMETKSFVGFQLLLMGFIFGMGVLAGLNNYSGLAGGIFALITLTCGLAKIQGSLNDLHCAYSEIDDSTEPDKHAV